VKARLEERATKPWLMIVDGFNCELDDQSIRPYLPSKGTGQMLFTTRNRRLVNDLVDLKRGGCIEVDAPAQEDAMRIFRCYVNETFLCKDEAHNYELLNLLHWPEMMRRIALHMNIERKTCTEVYIDLVKRDSWEIRHLQSKFVADIVKPVLGDLLHGHNRRSTGLSLLLQLCRFDSKNGIDEQLIKIETDSKMHNDLKRTLSELCACHFIRKSSEGSANTIYKTYQVIPPVEMVLLAWIEENEKPEDTLRCYNKILSMLFRRYDAIKRASRKRNVRGLPMKAAESRALLMPHFLRFVEFTSKPHHDVPFTFYDRAVHAILVFSGGLIDQDRLDDATRVLEFAQRHFEWENLEQQMGGKPQRRRGAYFALNSRLAVVYSSCPEDEKHLIKQAESLLQNLQEKAITQDSTETWEGKTTLVWGLALDLVRVHWKDDRLKTAHDEFGHFHKIGLECHNQNPILKGCRDEQKAEKEGERRRLAIRIKREEGLLNLATGNKCREDGKMTKAKEYWGAAVVAFNQANLAHSKWFPREPSSLFEIELYKAGALVQLKQDLVNAENIFKDALEQGSQQHQGSLNKRLCNIECSLNDLRLKRRVGEDIDAAEKSAKELFQRTRTALGVDNKLTIRCAVHLRDVYLATGRMKDAREIEKAVRKIPQLEESKLLTILSAKRIICSCVVLLVLGMWLVTRMA
jgi:hypothetical protein